MSTFVPQSNFTTIPNTTAGANTKVAFGGVSSFQIDVVGNTTSVGLTITNGGPISGVLANTVVQAGATKTITLPGPKAGPGNVFVWTQALSGTSIVYVTPGIDLGY